MNIRIAAAVLVTALAQTVTARDNSPITISDDIDTTVSVRNEDAAYWDRIQGSFDSMLDHEPYAGPTAITVALGVKDPVEIALHAPAVGRFTQPDDSYFANVDASFARDLHHTPYAGPTAVTVSRDLDHSIDRLVFAQGQERPAAVKMATVARNAGSDVE